MCERPIFEDKIMPFLIKSDIVPLIFVPVLGFTGGFLFRYVFFLLPNDRMSTKEKIAHLNLILCSICLGIGVSELVSHGYARF
ncbi:hypothetical protein HZS_84 [Henneguya salminicola]|nr:hypothetical protein HZS_84 [Henneguya salminicola]